MFSIRHMFTGVLMFWWIGVTNRLTISLPDDLWYKLVDVQVFKQKQTLSSVSMSDIIVRILEDTVNHGAYYQSIFTGKFTPEGERAPAMKNRTSNLDGETSCQKSQQWMCAVQNAAKNSRYPYLWRKCPINRFFTKLRIKHRLKQRRFGRRERDRSN